MSFNSWQFRSLICANVPEEFNTEDCLFHHFSMYGVVLAVVSSPRNGRAKIVFETAQDAAYAKKNGACIDESYPMMKLLYADDNRVSRIKNVETDVPAVDSTGDQHEAPAAIKRFRDVKSHDTRPIRSGYAPSGSGPRRSLSLHRPQLTMKVNVENENIDAVPSFSSTLVGSDYRSRSIFTSTCSKGRTIGNKVLRKAKTHIQQSHFAKSSSVRNEKKPEVEADNQQLKQSVFGKTSSSSKQTESPRIFSVFGRTSSSSFPANSVSFANNSGVKTCSTSPFVNSATSSVVSESNVGLKRGFRLDESATRIDAETGAPSKRQMTKPEAPSLFTKNSTSIGIAEKIEALKARDEKLRKTLGSLSSGKDAQIIGTCIEMCPELERYVRQSTNRVDGYEMTGNDADYSKFVKEYTRSSADKEIALPHEVRSIEGLTLSMDYLMDVIMNDYDRHRDDLNFNRGNWFNFLWNRTRSIRNDITVQNLHTAGAVALIEKIARFHIVCGYEMCDADYQDFDPKVNNEHYSKSLQTLKHMYYDLKQKQVSCPNEAEFRAYEVLKNLGNCGSTLLEACKFASEVWSNRDFQLAMKLHTAFSQGNFVRFLRLYKSHANFLMSCIMHPCLTDSRIAVMKCLANSCGASKNLYSIQELSNLLSFGSESETHYFCMQFGFSVDSNMLVEVRKLSPEDELAITDLPNGKDRSLVDSKKDKNFGEVINGAAINQWHRSFKVSSSFEGSNSMSVEPNSVDAVDFIKPVHEKQDLSQIASEVLDSLINQVTVDQISAAFAEIKRKAQVLKDVMSKLCLDIEEDVVAESVGYLCREVLLEMRQRLAGEAEQMQEDVLAEVVRSECRAIATEEIVEAKETQVVTEKVFDFICDDTVTELCRGAVERVLREESVLIFEKRVKRKYFCEWKFQFKQEVSNNFYRNNFPPPFAGWTIEHSSPNDQSPEKLELLSKLNSAERTLTDLAFRDLSLPFETDCLTEGILSKFLHVVILNVSPDLDMSRWFISKFKGKISANTGNVLNSGCIVRQERSSYLSHVCVSSITVDQYEKYLESFAANVLIILDPDVLLESNWVARNYCENCSSFVQLYVTGKRIEADTGGINYFTLDSTSLSAFAKSHANLKSVLHDVLKDGAEVYGALKPVGLKNLLADLFEEWFSSFYSHSFTLNQLDAMFRNCMTLQWLFDLYSTFVDQIRKFVFSHRLSFPLSVFKHSVHEADDLALRSVFNGLEIFSAKFLASALSCNSWIESLDVLENFLASLLMDSNRKKQLVEKIERLLVKEFRQLAPASDQPFVNAECFPWISALCEIISQNVDHILCHHAGYLNVYLDCATSEFVFDRPKWWNKFVKSVLNSKQLISYDVNGTL